MWGAFVYVIGGIEYIILRVASPSSLEAVRQRTKPAVDALTAQIMAAERTIDDWRFEERLALGAILDAPMGSLGPIAGSVARNMRQTSESISGWERRRSQLRSRRRQLLLLNLPVTGFLAKKI